MKFLLNKILRGVFMSKKYFDFRKYDAIFFDKIMERGIEIYLSDKMSDLNQKDNVYTCKIEGSDIYDVSVSFKNNSDEVDIMTCTCPFAKEGSNCKHMYALLLKIKCNYTDKKLKKEIKKGLKELKQIFKDFDRDSILFKYNNPEYSKDINNLKEQMNCFRTMYEKVLQNSKNDKLDLIVIKDIKNLIETLYKRIDNFNEYIQLKVNTNSKYQEEYEEYIEEDNSPGLFGTFMNLLDSVNKEQEKRDKEYEEEKQRYRRAIIEQNLYEGKNNEDMYDGLDN